MKIFSLYFCLFFGGYFAVPSYSQNYSAEETVKQWEKLEKIARKYVDLALKQALPALVKANSEAKISPKCSNSVMKLIIGLRRMKTWAFEMLDAAGKPGGGIMEGTLIAFGSYDQCLSIEAKDKPNGKEYFRGKYCTVSIQPPVPPKPEFYTMHHKFASFANFTSSKTFIRTFSKDLHFFLFLTYRLGICVPSTCNGDDLQSVLNMILKDLEGVSANIIGCEIKEPIVLNKLQIIIIALVCALVGLVILSTIIHLVYRSTKPDHLIALPSNQGHLLSIFLAFSLHRSMKRLTRIETTLRQSKAIHGLRALSFFWIIFGNIFLYSNYQVIRQLKMAVVYSCTILFQVLVSSPLGFDTFFFISGYILAYGVAQSSGNIKLLYVRHLFHYLIRIIPGYLLVIAFVFIVPITNSGPSWHENLDPMVEGCRNNWWTNLLFINNFNITGTEKCLHQSWYIACDFQLFIIGLIVTSLMAWSRVGLIINLLLIILSVSITGIMISYLKLPPTILFSQVDVVQRQGVENLLFNRPYPHLGSFCLGLALGHILAHRSAFKLKNFTKLLGWCLAIICMLSVTFGVYEWNFHEQIATTATTLYGAAHRLAWTLGIAWVMFLCATRNAGVVNTVLSWTPLRAISRLSLMAYLFHPIILTTLTSHLRERIQITPYVIIFVMCGLSCLSLTLSFFSYVLLTAPIMEIEEMYFGKKVVEKKRIYEKSDRISKKLKELEAKSYSDSEKHGTDIFRKIDIHELEKNKVNGVVILHL
ncbi:nose resistant to fluoxetine protein 6-like [Centruroides sculpturatus]|uniref:nose resistant to fluoxetine protein 6-like n=1 Tax=Centruroides sculpturatus TaxID=218467 RepID=UPI000C6E0887|nr:nose resistant to fluoxetine protein 6-like [Centruroides sculpturatus]